MKLPSISIPSRSGALLLLSLLFLAAAAFAQAPGVITYQGRITNNGANFTGIGQFRFVIYRNGPLTSYWSHDGSSVGGAMPVTAVSLPVSNGLFAVGLGDTTVPGMSIPIPAAIFSNSSLRLRIWFSDGVAASAVIADHPITSVGYAFFAMEVPNGSITSAKIATGAIGSTQLANDATFTRLRLMEVGDLTEAATIEAVNGSGMMVLRDTFSLETVRLQAATAIGEGALLELRNGNNRISLVADGDASGRAGSIGLYDDTPAGGDQTLTVLLRGDDGGNNTGGVIRVFNNAGVLHGELDSQGVSGGGEVVLYQADGDTGAVLYGDEGNGAGALSLRNTSGSARFRAYGGPSSGSAELFDADGTETIKLLGEQSGSGGSRVEMSRGDGTLTVILDGQVGTGGGGYLQLLNAAGAGTITLNSDSSGDGRITTQVLEITGGSDFSENFDIRAGDAQPGMLVRIDAAHPGELAVSDRAYDRAVAGVVSGAGGVKPGLMMGQRGTAADGQHPVALTGRVYCLVDAERGAIEPGDLITTSDTPGHGMKVDDHARAQGAIIGKAMTGLAHGRGLVLVLVTLQ